MAPALVLDTLRQAARERGALVLAEQVADALSDGSLPQSGRTWTWRRALVLELANEPGGGPLALDTVGIVGSRSTRTWRSSRAVSG